MSFLDVMLDLTACKYKPDNKPGNIPLYINVKSNHPPNIIKNLPESISRRINKLSSYKSVFDNSKDLYNNALSSSSFKDQIKFNPDFNMNISRNKIDLGICKRNESKFFLEGGTLEVRFEAAVKFLSVMDVLFVLKVLGKFS